MRTWRAGALAGLSLLLAACASGPKYNEVQASFPRLREGEGRIFFYREASPIGAALRPDVKLGGQAVGTSVPGSFFFVDRPAGRHVATAATEAESRVDVDVRAGGTAYVRVAMTMGVLVYRPELQVRGAAEATQALPNLAYVGSVPATRGQAAAPAAPGGSPARTPAPAPVTMDDLRGLLPEKR